jgi:molybdopterin-binding protein
MVFHRSNVIVGAALTLAAGLGAIEPALARPVSPLEGQLLSQVNVPQREGVPRVNTLEVRGIVTGIQGEQVQIRTVDGEIVSYDISEEDQELYGFEVGDDIVLLVRDETVIGINPPITPEDPDAAVTTGAINPPILEQAQPEVIDRVDEPVGEEEAAIEQETIAPQPQVTQPPQPQVTQQPVYEQPVEEDIYEEPIDQEPVRALW